MCEDCGGELSMHMYPVNECAYTYMHVCINVHMCVHTHFSIVWKEILVSTSLGLWCGIREFSV